MKIIKEDKYTIFFTFLLLTVSNSGYIVSIGLDDYIAYLGYGIFLIKLLYNFFIIYDNNLTKIFTKFNLIIFFLLTSGILVQSLDLSQKLRLIITMVIIISFAMFSNYVARSPIDIKTGALGIISGLIIAVFIAVIVGFPLMSEVSEGVSATSFNGGINHKNTFGFLLLASTTGLLTYKKITKEKYFQIISKQSLLNTILIVLEFLLILTSGSRGALLLLIIFVGVLNSDILMKKFHLTKHGFLTIFFLIFTISLIVFVTLIAPKSATFAVRIQGFVSWINIYITNPFVMLFGFGSEAFKNGNYNENVRNLINWKGTTEMGVLSIFVKNGLLGFIAYLLIFASYIKKSIYTKNMGYLVSVLALITTMIISTITEPYLVNIAVCYGTFSFMLLNCLFELIKEEANLDDATLYDNRNDESLVNSLYKLNFVKKLTILYQRDFKN